MKKVMKGLLWIFLVLGILAGAGWAWIKWSNHRFEETFYTIYSYKVETPVRAVLLSDLHQCLFGADNEELVSRIRELGPDIILIAGDVINKSETDIEYALSLCSRLAEIAPVYYGLGNHENEVIYGSDLNREYLEARQEELGEEQEDFTPLIQNRELLQGLDQAGVCVVQNRSVLAEIKGSLIRIGGISTNVSSFWPYSEQFVHEFIQAEDEVFKILISHRPEPAAEYILGEPVDLVVSGHNHGGIIRIPGKGGVFSADGGFFPQYTEGMTKQGEMTMIVGRGLGGHGMLPRIFNPPELVIIDIN